jgi:hypothetical protein
MLRALRDRSRSPVPVLSSCIRRTDMVGRALFLRTWMRHLVCPPTVLDGQMYFETVKPNANWPGNIWLRFEVPRELSLGGRTYAVDFTLWHGETLAAATELPLHRGSANKGRALILNWPRAPRGRGRVIVSRLVGMSFLFDEPLLRSQGFTRYAASLDVHHRDHVHENCLLGNLRVEFGPSHVSRHNRER